MKYARIHEWGPGFDRCVITPATEEIIERDGDNLIGHDGQDGYKIDVYDTLKEAVEHACAPLDVTALIPNDQVKAAMLM